MLDTNIFLFLVGNKKELSHHVWDIVMDPGNSLCMSIESVREIIIKQREKDFEGRRWNTVDALLRDIKEDYFISILPTDLNVMRTLFSLRINTFQDHRDPFDHLIISHAMTCKIPLISADHKFPFYRQQGLMLVEN